MRATPLAVLLALCALSPLSAGCRDKASSDYVADEFADAYFRRMDQEAALHYTALGATDMLDKELSETKALRESGYTPSEAAANVYLTRGPAVPRDARVDYRFDITARPEDSPAVQRVAEIELAKIDGVWKVVGVRYVQ